jgi:hypothetical protein
LRTHGAIKPKPVCEQRERKWQLSPKISDSTTSVAAMHMLLQTLTSASRRRRRLNRGRRRRYMGAGRSRQKHRRIPAPAQDANGIRPATSPNLLYLKPPFRRSEVS